MSSQFKIVETTMYRAEMMPELPSGPNGLKVLYFPGGNPGGGHDGLIVKVNPVDAEPWIGIFEFGKLSLDELVAAPDQKRLCVVSQGSGYLVAASDPADWCSLPVLPVNGIFVVPDHEILIFNNFTDVYALGPEGIIWQTKKLASDSVKINVVDAQQIQGTAFKYGQTIAFSVDIRTGEFKTKVEE